MRLYEVTGVGPAMLARIVDRVAHHPDVTAWPVRLRDRLFVVASGDEGLMPPVAEEFPSAVLGAHSTLEHGYWLVDRESAVAPDRVAIGDTTVGDGSWWCAAGPCALESVADTIQTAHVLRAQGVRVLRMGLFKVRSSPYHFLGKGRRGLSDLAEVKRTTGLPVITEVLDPRDVEATAEVADGLQVDGRNATNRALLAELGMTSRPVLLMRGPGSTVTEWLRAAEFVASAGNCAIVLVARGITSFDDSLAFQPDLGAIAAVRRVCDLPVIFDPSHSTGRRDAVAAASLAAAAFGADGLLVESYLYPERLYRPGDAGQMYPPRNLGALLRACAELRATADTLRSATRSGVAGR